VDDSFTGRTILCLMSCLLGDNRDVFFPKLDQGLHLITFSRIAERYLERLGYKPVGLPEYPRRRNQNRTTAITSNSWPVLADISFPFHDLINHA